jgi:hypothetical protein
LRLRRRGRRAGSFDYLILIKLPTEIKVPEEADLGEEVDDPDAWRDVCDDPTREDAFEADHGLSC